MRKLDKLIKQRYELTMQKIEIEGKIERGAGKSKDHETLKIVLEKLEDLKIRIKDVENNR